MEKFVYFTAVMGLLFGGASLLLFLLRFTLDIWYNHTESGRKERDFDKLLHGGRYVFPLLRPLVVAVVGLGWFFTWWLA